ncbi:hypothetical protein [Thalassomonas actiniarum]|uniref:Uncharacterized protein n=1 Tax=Thalassomonas actiniarum TaxID=485447 RepID=A0AAF0C581_9GAMM|nr:hypothetical protein [Thalassomonas actiniarum]WDE01243.1 hypothetical protein SG35_011715 [Thalassomonas actiniarum]
MEEDNSSSSSFPLNKPKQKLAEYWKAILQQSDSFDKNVDLQKFVPQHASKKMIQDIIDDREKMILMKEDPNKTDLSDKRLDIAWTYSDMEGFGDINAMVKTMLNTTYQLKSLGLTKGSIQIYESTTEEMHLTSVNAIKLLKTLAGLLEIKYSKELNAIVEDKDLPEEKKVKEVEIKRIVDEIKQALLKNYCPGFDVYLERNEEIKDCITFDIPSNHAQQAKQGEVKYDYKQYGFDGNNALGYGLFRLGKTSLPKSFSKNQISALINTKLRQALNVELKGGAVGYFSDNLKKALPIWESRILFEEEKQKKKQEESQEETLRYLVLAHSYKDVKDCITEDAIVFLWDNNSNSIKPLEKVTDIKGKRIIVVLEDGTRFSPYELSDLFCHSLSPIGVSGDQSTTEALDAITEKILDDDICIYVAATGQGQMLTDLRQAIDYIADKDFTYGVSEYKGDNKQEQKQKKKQKQTQKKKQKQKQKQTESIETKAFLEVNSAPKTSNLIKVNPAICSQLKTHEFHELVTSLIIRHLIVSKAGVENSELV